METSAFDVCVRVAPELLPEPPTEASRVVVVYRRWGGGSIELEVASTAAAPRVSLEVPAPPPEVWSMLPAELGGPWEFALGYVLLKQVEPTPEVRAVASTRLVWTRAPFPEAGFRAALQPQDLTDDVLAHLATLSRLPVGPSLARSTTGRRSLVGFEPYVGDILLDTPGTWPTPGF